MDPQATICDLLDAMQRNDREAVDELLDALKGWNKAGGFMPIIRKSLQANQYSVYRYDRTDAYRPGYAETNNSP
jgi:membrane protease subunit (stomatin/prohibitin family)